MKTQADIRVFTSGVPDAHFIGPFMKGGQLFYIPPTAYSYPSRHKQAMYDFARLVGGLYYADTDHIHVQEKVYMPMNVTPARCIYRKLYMMMEITNVQFLLT